MYAYVTETQVLVRPPRPEPVEESEDDNEEAVQQPAEPAVYVLEKIVSRTGPLPKNWLNISNFRYASADVHKAHGWIPLVDDIPTYDAATETVVRDRYDIGPDSVTAVYRVEPIDRTEELAEAAAQAAAIEARSQVLVSEVVKAIHETSGTRPNAQREARLLQAAKHVISQGRIPAPEIEA